MSNPTESPLSAAAADALSGTADAHTGAIYNTIGAGTYYTAAYQKEAIWNRIMALPNELRVVKDGTLTFGVMPGRWTSGATSVLYSGSAGNSLTDGATNHIYLAADGGALWCTTAGFPTNVAHIPLATIACSGGTYSSITDYRGCTRQPVGARFNVEASTAGAGAPNVLTANEDGKTVTNEGAAARAYNALPSAGAGLSFEFVVQDSDGLRVAAATGNTIRVSGTVSASGGYIQNATVGSAIRLVAVNTTEWIAVSIVGTWTVDS